MRGTFYWHRIIVLALALLIAPAALAQEGAPDVVAEGLNNPRLMHYDDDGALYIAEAGLAGEDSVETRQGPRRFGTTARVMVVRPDGAGAAPLVEGLISTEGFDNYIGVQSVETGDGSLWLVLGDAPAEVEGHSAGVLVLDENLAETRFVDLRAIEEATNPDQDFVVSNPQDIALADDGSAYVIDASGNALYHIPAEGEPELVHVWEDLPVPTSVAIGPEGDLFVGFLTGFPFQVGASRIERWSAEGELLDTIEGLSFVTDVQVADDGTIYAVEFAGGFGDMGWAPDSGRVVRVADGEITPLLEGLNFPYGVAEAPDGSLVVSVNTAFSEPGSGMVVRVPAAGS